VLALGSRLNADQPTQDDREQDQPAKQNRPQQKADERIFLPVARF